MEIKFFDRTVEAFVEKLEGYTYAKTLRTLDLLEQFGNLLRMPHGKNIGHGLFELRVQGRQEVRILYAFSGKAIILLVGFFKKTQRIPRQWIDLAKKRLSSLDFK